MSNYYLILFWLGIIAVISSVINVYKYEDVNGEQALRYRFGWALLIFLPVVIWAGWRGNFIDTGAYVQMFTKNLPGSIGGLYEYMQSVTKDKGFYFLSAIIKIFLTKDEHIYLLILAAIQGICLVKVYRKYSTRYLISIFLFIASTDYLSWMFNGIRQFTAVALIFVCTPLLMQKKYLKYIVIVVIASQIHGSALLMIPFAFIVQGKAMNKKALLFLAVVILCIAYVGEFTNVLDSMLQDTQYTNVVSDWMNSEDDGTNILRVLVYAMPTILAVVGRNFIWDADDKIINMCVNMSIVSTGFYIISMFTSGIFIGRLPIYFSLYNYILLPWEIDHIFTKQSARLVYVGLIGAYLIFYYYQISIVWGLV